MHRRTGPVAAVIIGLSAMLAACAPKLQDVGRAKYPTALKATVEVKGLMPGATYRLGRRAEDGDIRSASISVAPDGQGLPPGRGSAFEGRRLYADQCAMCHGAKGEGAAAYPALVGGMGTLASARPLKTIGSYWPYATTVFDYIRRAMPYTAPGSLTPDQTYAVTAYLLAQNKIIDEQAVLDQHNLANVVMPNRNGFIDDPRPDVANR